MYKLFLSLITILCIITGGHLMSIPVFGTKRYHRTPSISSGTELGTSSSNIPYYNQLSTYYDNQPSQYNSGSQIPINSINNNYQNGYLSENGYYYYPRHEYHSYGMPTYHGEYKPTPYYYAPAPHYSYYDDRDIISNPMDDLHEEILHEDERERQRELQPMQQSYGQENWYQTQQHINNNNNQQQQQQQDELTNNFLKNLIEYNRQIDAQQKLQQQQQDELMQRDQEHKLQLQYQQQLQQQQLQQQHQQQQPFNDEYDEYVELGDYEYEPQPLSDNIYDMKKYERLDNSQPNYERATTQSKTIYNPLQQQQQQMKLVSKHFDNNNNDDEDVRQLKSLAHHLSNGQKNLQLSKTNNNNNKIKSTTKSNDHKLLKMKNYNSQEDDISDDYNNFNWNPSSQIQKEQPIIQPSVKSYAQYDNEPEEYDDDAWISWDRKRSPPTTTDLKTEKINMNKWKQSLNKIESIKAFNNRKPLIVKVKDFKEIPTEKSVKIETTTTSSSRATASSTIKNNITTYLPTKINEKLLKSGQKEIVIPRPANNPQSNLFTGFNMFVKQNDDDSSIDNLKDDQKRNNKDKNVYDTIKKLLTMEHKLERTPISSKVQKRFVTNEESLVNELNNLKRSAT